MVTLTDYADLYSQQLTKEAVDYLTGPTRLLNKQTIKHFKLGWIDKPEHPSHQQYVGCPTIPYLTTSGRVITLRARTDGKAKYMPLGYDYPLNDVKTFLFNGMQALPTSRRSTTVLCEGEFDAMIAWQDGYKAVGLPGASSWRHQWGYLFASSRVLIAFDGDRAGVEAADRVAERLREFRAQTEIIHLPDSHDLTSYYGEHGSLAPLLGEP